MNALVIVLLVVQYLACWVIFYGAWCAYFTKEFPNLKYNNEDMVGGIVLGGFAALLSIPGLIIWHFVLWERLKHGLKFK